MPSVKRQPRVLFVVPALAQGGAEMWTVSLCRHLRRFGNVGILVTGGIYHPDTVAEVRKLGVPLIVPSERVCPDVVVTWGIPDIRRHIGPVNTPVVQVSHCGPGFASEASVLADAAWQATHWTAVCNDAKASYPESYWGKVAVIESGAELDRVNAPPSQRAAVRRQLGLNEPAHKIVLWVGRFDEEKRPELFVDAVEHLPDCWLPVMIGDGPQRGPCIERAEQADRKIAFLRYRQDIAPIFVAADVFCSTSRTEAMPLTLLEAWLAGVPVVSTATGFVLDAVSRHGGLMAQTLPVRCSAEAVANAIVDLGECDAVAAQRVAKEHYTAAAMADRWEEYLLTEVLGDG